MNRMVTRFLAASILAVGCTGAAVAQGTTPPPSTEGAQQMAIEGLKQLMEALSLFVKSVPQYSTPEVLPNGDIIIRRVHPDDAPAKSPSPAPDETHT